MRVLIIEDEQRSATKLSRYLVEADSAIQVDAIIPSIRSGVEYFKKNEEPDLIFLDIHLSDGESFKIFEKVSVDSLVIILTAYDDYAIRAFDLNCIGYLLKPFTKADIVAGLKKYEKFTSKRNTIQHVDSRRKKNQYLSRLLVKRGASFKTLLVEEVSHFIKDQLVFLVTINNEKYVYDSTLDELESQLNPDDFFRVNRQAIIQYSAIDSFTPASSHRYDIRLKGSSGIKLSVSQGKVAEFKNWIIR